MPETCESLETLVWQPESIMDGDLLMYLRAARSMAAFVGWCDGGSTDDGCAAASMDETTINSLHMLHQHTYDTGKALQALVKIINPKSVDKRWSDEDAKKFVRGLKQHGKNFFKIRKDLLSNKETPQLVEYYYLWKKTPAASTTRPHRRHRRPVRRQATPTLPSSEYAEEMSSGSEGSGNESYEETDQSTVPSYTCHQCLSAKSDHWHGSGKDRMFCSDCFSFLPKYDDDPVADEATEPPPFMFRPVKDETVWKHSIPELEKLGPEGKVGIRCPETSDEGRQEERASPSTGSTYSSRSSPTKDIVAPASEPEGVAPTVHPSIVAPKCYAENLPDDTAPKARTGSPSESVSDGSSIYAVENEERESDADNNPDEGSPGPCSNTPSPAEHLSRAPGCIAAKADNSSSANEDCRNSELQALPKELETVEDKARCKISTFSSDPSISVQSCGWPGLGVAEGKAPEVVVKEEPNYEVESLCPAVKIKKEMLSDDHDDCDQMKRVQVPLHGQAPWAEVKNRDDVKPQRAVASVAPTQFAKLENSEAMQAGGRTPPPHFPLNPPPPLAPLSAASPLKVAVAPEATRNDSTTPLLRMSPAANMPRPSEISYKSQAGFMSGPSLRAREHYLEDRRRPQSPVMLLHRDRSRSCSRSRSQSPAQDSDFEPDVRRSPSPEPRRTNKECYRSERSIIIKRWDRGFNTCSRCDFEFVPPPGSKLAQRREERMMKACHGGSGGKFHHGPGSSISKETRKAELRKEEEKKKPNTPPENRTSDAQITSSLMASHHMSGYVPERLTPRGPYPVGHDPTPALSQLSAYARPHIGSAAAARDLQRCMPPFPLSSFPPQSMDPYFRMPGVYPPGSREVIEMEIEREREREMRDLEFMEKLKQDMELKPPGFDRLPPHLGGAAAGAVDPLWAELHRRNMVLPGGPPGHLANIYPGNLTDLSLIQRERERNAEIARLTQEHQLAAAARDSSALQQLYQRYSHDPAVLQRHLSTYLASKAHETEVARLMEASHLVYHFARADPLATAGPAAAQGAPSALPPHLPPTHGMSPGHPLLMAAREQERMYLELINRPPYNTDPLMAQQLSVQMAHTHEVIRQMERDCMGPGSLMLH